MRFEIVFKRPKYKQLETTNTLLQKLFGENCEIDWRDNYTVEIHSTEVTSVDNTEFRNGEKF